MRLHRTIIAALALVLLGACRAKHTAVESLGTAAERHTESTIRTDTLREHESMADYNSLTVLPVDSAYMAERYGVQLPQTGRIYLAESISRSVRTHATERRQEDRTESSDTVREARTLKKTVEVERKPTVWERLMLSLGGVAMWALAIMAAASIYKNMRKKWN